MTDTTVYSFKKIIKLLENCNPNTIELLGLNPEHYVFCNSIGKELLNNKTEICEYDLLKIKQDLEVLGIIKKQLLRSKYGVYKSKINAVVEYNKITMREIKEDEFDREDFNKLKQWLEVN